MALEYGSEGDRRQTQHNSHYETFDFSLNSAAAIQDAFFPCRQVHRRRFHIIRFPVKTAPRVFVTHNAIRPRSVSS